MMEKPSILTKEDFEFFDKRVFNDNGRTLNSYIYDPSNIILFFNRGFVLFSISEKDIDGYDGEIVCDLIAFYKSKKSKLQRKFLLDNFWNFLRVNKCSKVNMLTKIDPKFWEENYNFKLKRYEMELKL